MHNPIFYRGAVDGDEVSRGEPLSLIDRGQDPNGRIGCAPHLIAIVNEGRPPNPLIKNVFGGAVTKGDVMENKEMKQGRSWGEKNGGTLFGVGVFLLLGLMIVLMG